MKKNISISIVDGIVFRDAASLHQAFMELLAEHDGKELIGMIAEKLEKMQMDERAYLQALSREKFLFVQKRMERALEESEQARKILAAENAVLAAENAVLVAEIAELDRARAAAEAEKAELDRARAAEEAETDSLINENAELLRKIEALEKQLADQ